MIKLDLHTHSTDSPDGGISLEEYAKLLDNGTLDYIAITDHNSTSLAVKAQNQFGDKIIVGEEIMTTEGEIIGLFLESTIPPNMTPEATIAAIMAQDGIVYIPHPFETIRKGIHPAVLEKIVEDVDIIEVCNGRAFAQNRSEQTVVWAKMNHIPGAASSDAHGIRGIGRTYSSVKEAPNRENLVELIKESTPITSRPSFRSLLYPKYHKLKKKVKK